jgi:hypothetical protein
MGEIIKNWNDGGSLSVAYTGDGDGTAVISSTENEGAEREAELRFIDASRSVIVVRRVVQAAGQSSVETYTRLAYIECNGQQYINTGYIVQEDDVLDMDFIRTSSTSADKAIFGVSDGTNGLWFSCYGKIAYYRFGNNASKNDSDGANKYHVVLKKGNVNIDGDTEDLPFIAMPIFPLYLFARNSLNTGVNMFGYCRSRNFKITKTSGEVVMDLKACRRNSDGAIGMIDLVSGNFFANQGSGDDFIAGGEAAISDDYEIIDYVTFAKDKLYDLGIVKSTYQLEVMFARSEKSTTPYLYGCVTSPHTASVTAYLSSGGAWRFGSSYKGLNTNNTNINRNIISNGKTEFNFTSSTFTKSTFTTPNTVVLGGYRAADGSLTKNYQGKVYYFRITEGSDVILDWLPCRRKIDGIEGFWDCVTQTFVEPM